MMRAAAAVVLVLAGGCSKTSPPATGDGGAGGDGGGGSNGSDGGSGGSDAPVTDGCTPGAPGTLDTCFGFAPGPTMSNAVFAASTALASGKILVYGAGVDAAQGPNTRPIIARLLATGAPDPSFHAVLPTPASGSTFTPVHVVERPDHRLLVTGQYGNQYGQVAYIVGLLADGGADPAGPAGPLAVPNENYSYGQRVLVAADNTYYVTGTSQCEITFTCDTKQFFAAHFDAAGKLDTNYGVGGWAAISYGTHTSLLDATLTPDGVVLFGRESEPIVIAGSDSTYNRGVIGALDTTGKPRAGFGTAGAIAVIESPATEVGSLPQAFRVESGGTITVAMALPTDQLFAITSAGVAGTGHTYDSELTSLAPTFARDGSIFVAVEDYPMPRFAHFSAAGVADAAFASADLVIPGLPSGSAVLDTQAVEQADAWLVTAHLYLANSNPDDELLLFRVWK